MKDTANKLKDKQTRYLHYDALDSVDMITDAYGIVVERRSFDPWGKKRNVIWRKDNASNLVQELITNRGFTGYEHIEEVGLIHMNGRVYDQELGRFLSADPLVQAPFMTNSFNRYSYVMNNPLKYTDPTGFEGKEKSSTCGPSSSSGKPCGPSDTPKNGSNKNDIDHPDDDDNDNETPKAGTGKIPSAEELNDLGLEDGRVESLVDKAVDFFTSASYIAEKYHELKNTLNTGLDYPESEHERSEALNLAWQQAGQLLVILLSLQQYVHSIGIGLEGDINALIKA